MESFVCGIITLQMNETPNQTRHFSASTFVLAGRGHCTVAGLPDDKAEVAIPQDGWDGFKWRRINDHQVLSLFCKPRIYFFS